MFALVYFAVFAAIDTSGWWLGAVFGRYGAIVGGFVSLSG